jgi:serine phosphatase RsbU (regulator of sigma subunit)
MAARLAEGYRGLEAVNRRMTHDRAFAGRLQRRMLPAALPTAGPFRFAVEYRPCEDLGGDFYDVFPLNGRRERGDRGDSADPDSPDTPVAMYVADVSGHGIGAALITVFVREAIARLRDRGDRGHAVLMSPSAVLSALRSRFAEEDFGTLFVTMIYGVLDPRTGRFRFASAGHPMPMGEWDGVVGEIPGDTGPVIGGFLPEMPFPEHEIEVPAAGRLLLYTDGLTDAVGDDGRALGPERLRRMLAEGAGRSGRDWMALSSAALSAHVGSRPPTDDVTLLAVTAEGAKCGVRSAKPERMAEADSVAEAERTAALVEERT